jgi:SAM-dependent methyltransferase
MERSAEAHARPMPFAVPWFDANAPRRAAAYESRAAADAHSWFAAEMPSPGLAVDVGAGSGRDAAWLASLGHRVLAVEPSAGMRAQAAALHGDCGAEWVDDALPGLDALRARGVRADLILLSAVWMFVEEADRPAAMRSLAAIAAPGCFVALSLRSGPPEPGLRMIATDGDATAKLALDTGFRFVLERTGNDALGRSDVGWRYLGLRMPDGPAAARRAKSRAQP